jgi:hypothetical protein
MRDLHILDLPVGTVLEIRQVRHGHPVPEGYQPAAWSPSHHDQHISGAAARIIDQETHHD